MSDDFTPDGATWDHIIGFDPLVLAEFREDIIELIACEPWGISEYIVIVDGILTLDPSFITDGASRAQPLERNRCGRSRGTEQP